MLSRIRKALVWLLPPFVEEAWWQLEVESRKLENKEKGEKHFAFTLAEVLITLGIIGVVAALTIPTLIQKQNEKSTVVKLKKVYSMLSQAYIMAQTNDGNISEWYAGNESHGEAGQVFYNHMKKYLKVMKDCGNEQGCFTNGYLRNLNLTQNHVDYDNRSNEYKIILNDGVSVMFFIDNINCKDDEFCGNIKIDIDGKGKGKYAWGRDMFLFTITTRRLYPEGIADAAEDSSFENLCNLANDSSTNGIGCTAWVIYNENMDYLHCNDLSWNGKTKCN